MCGIGGIVRLDGGPVDEAPLRRMNALQRHRGPDGEGVWRDGPVGLAHTRLAIIDLSEAGLQPMVAPGRAVLVYNGEIYNYRELRSELDYPFRSQTDSEVVLAAYLAWGPDCVRRFNGMWSFAIWDLRERTLFASRDRFGIKPFYYVEGDAFRFASEIKALEPARPNWRALRTLLADGAFAFSEETSFEGVRALEPGRSLSLRDGRVRIERHWDFKPGGTPRDPVERFDELLTDSIRLRLRADVPVGTCLSGGLDSSTIVSIAAKSHGVRAQSFSSVFDEPDCNEARYIDAVVEDCGLTPHRTTPRPENFYPVMEEVVRYQDEPIPAPGIYPQWHVMAAARGNVKVLLDGQGADELLAGYHGYLAPFVLARAKAGAVDEAAATLLLAGRLIPRVYWTYLLETLMRRPGHFTFRRRADMFARGFEREVAPLNGEAPPARFDDPMQELLFDNLTRRGLPALLLFEDRNSMAHSIEARVPFLDVRLVEFCLNLAFHWKLRAGTTKYILRRAAERWLHPAVLHRRDKMGYPVPFGAWIRGPLRERTRRLLFEGEGGVIDPTFLRRAWDYHQAGLANNDWLIWRWVVFELWARRWNVRWR